MLNDKKEYLTISKMNHKVKRQISLKERDIFQNFKSKNNIKSERKSLNKETLKFQGLFPEKSLHESDKTKYIIDNMNKVNNSKKNIFFIRNRMINFFNKITKANVDFINFQENFFMNKYLDNKKLFENGFKKINSFSSLPLISIKKLQDSKYNLKDSDIEANNNSNQNLRKNYLESIEMDKKKYSNDKRRLLKNKVPLESFLQECYRSSNKKDSYTIMNEDEDIIGSKYNILQIKPKNNHNDFSKKIV